MWVRNTIPLENSAARLSRFIIPFEKNIVTPISSLPKSYLIHVSTTAVRGSPSHTNPVIPSATANPANGRSTHPLTRSFPPSSAFFIGSSSQNRTPVRDSIPAVFRASARQFDPHSPLDQTAYRDLDQKKRGSPLRSRADKRRFGVTAKAAAAMDGTPGSAVAAGAVTGTAAPLAKLSRRIVNTDEPVIVQMRDLMTLNPDVMSLGQGVVYWLPPDAVLAAAQAAVHDPVSSGYGVDDGTKELRAALVEKVKTENGLMDSSIMVTAGANQAFVNVVLTLCDPDDAVVLFKPFYFNHQMAFQMTGVTDIVYGPCDSDTLHPSADWLEEALSGKEGRKVPKVVVITNPNNPTGTYVPEDLLRRISAICEKAGSWLVLDNTYEYFMYGGNRHVCLEAPHVLNIFSFSKAYGMMGWRVGYIAYPNSSPGLGPSLIKAQDTIPICANLIGQQAALAALQSPSAGKPFVDRLIQTLSPNLEEARDALAMLTGPGVGGRVWGGEGAIYLWAKLPEGCEDDGAVVRWLVSEHGVVVIPGSASGAPGHIRVSFANLPAEKYKVAAGRLKKGLQELVEKGMRFPLSQ